MARGTRARSPSECILKSFEFAERCSGSPGMGRSSLGLIFFLGELCNRVRNHLKGCSPFRVLAV